MTTDLVMLLIVQGVLWGFYALCPWWALRRWTGRETWPVRLVLALLAGTVSQAVLGFAWGALVRRPAVFEGVLYILFWSVAGLLARRTRNTGPDVSNSLPRLEQYGIMAILFAGLAARLLHPLKTWALGQSDAYSHLAMFRDVVAAGALQNTVYPPGYAWVMAMPAAVFQIDPYYVARFGGAFFGVALILAVYFLLSEGCRARGAALAGSFLVACFPGLGLLIKTGVGAFANQFGLFLLPLLFAGVLLANRADNQRLGLWVLAVSFAGLLLSVPMMLLHAVMVLGLFQVLWWWKQRAALPRALPGLFFVLLVALGVALALVVRFGSRTLTAMAVVLSTADETVAANVPQDSIGGLAALGILVRDFCGIKRWGIGHPLFDAAFAALLVVFAALAFAGIRRKEPGNVFVGCWGALAVVQTATGCLQFTAYQREGWSLMIAAGCLGGWVIAGLWSRFRFLRPLVLAGVVLSVALTFWRPPSHRLTNSTAEETLVRVARMMRDYPRLPEDADPAVEDIRRFLLAHAMENTRLSIVTRPLMQEHLLRAVAGQPGELWFSTSDIWRNYDVRINESAQSLVLLDRPESLEAAQFGVFAGISPAGARSFLEQQERSYKFNDTLESHIRNLPTGEWNVAVQDASPHLRLYYVARKSGPDAGLVREP